LIERTGSPWPIYFSAVWGGTDRFLNGLGGIIRCIYEYRFKKKMYVYMNMNNMYDYEMNYEIINDECLDL
jgi:hypothetical protein